MSSSSMSSSLPTTPGRSPLLAPVPGLPEGLLIGTALVCVVWAAALGALARQRHIARPLVWCVVLGNGVWVAASVALLAFGWMQPSGLGTAFLVAQAVAVGVFAELQWWAMRRA